MPRHRKTDAERWQRSADRENARRDRKAPLFAWGGLVPHVTAAERQEAVEGRCAALFRQLAEGRAKSARLAVRYRADVGAVVSPEELAALDARWAAFRGPKEDPTYLASYWHTKKRDLGLCAPYCDCYDKEDPQP